MDPSTATLLRLAAVSPREGFAGLYLRARRQLLLWAALHVKPPLRQWMPLSDFVQEVWSRAYSGFALFDPRRGRFHPWLFGIAYNVLREHLRALRIRHQFAEDKELDQLPGHATTVVSSVARDEATTGVIQAIDALDDIDRRIAVWRGLEGRSHSEIADRIGISTDAAECRWRRVRAQLRLVLADFENDGNTADRSTAR